MQHLGVSGDIDAETAGLLLQYEVDTREFSHEVLQCLPNVDDEHPWKIPQVNSVISIIARIYH
jgi:hypothetical protein